MITSDITGANSKDLARLAWLTLRSGGRRAEAAHEAEIKYGANSRIHRIARDIVLAGTAASLGPTYNMAFQDWLTRPRDAGFLYISAPSARRGKVNVPNLLLTSYAVGGTVAQGAAKPVLSLDFDLPTLTERKAAAIFVCTPEFLKLTDGVQPLESAMETAITAGVDAAIISDIMDPSWPSFGSSGDPLEDVRTLIDAVGAKAASRLFMVARATTFANMGLLALGGARMFPDLDYRGGELAGARAVAMDSLPANVLAIVDATKTIVDPGTVVFDSSREALLQMNSTPDSPPTAATPMTSLFQRNLVGLLVETRFGLMFLEGSVARVEGINYGALAT